MTKREKDYLRTRKSVKDFGKNWNAEFADVKGGGANHGFGTGVVHDYDPKVGFNLDKDFAAIIQKQDAIKKERAQTWSKFHLSGDARRLFELANDHSPEAEIERKQISEKWKLRRKERVDRMKIEFLKSYPESLLEFILSLPEGEDQLISGSDFHYFRWWLNKMKSDFDSDCESWYVIFNNGRFSFVYNGTCGWGDNEVLEANLSHDRVRELITTKMTYNDKS